MNILIIILWLLEIVICLQKHSMKKYINAYDTAAVDIKLIQNNVPGQPQMIKEILRDDTPQGRDLITALNDNEMPYLAALL